MFDKFAINNELITLKKEIEKVSLFLTRKCIKSIKNLNKILETKKNKEKLEKQSTKLVNELYILKHLNYLDIAKYALITKDPKKTLSHFKSTPTERIHAKICMHKTISDNVKVIKSKYNLDEEKNWEKKIFELGQKKQRKLKKISKINEEIQDTKESVPSNSKIIKTKKPRKVSEEEPKESTSEDNESDAESNDNEDIDNDNEYIDNDSEDIENDSDGSEKMVKKEKIKATNKPGKKQTTESPIPTADETNLSKITDRKNNTFLNKFSEAPTPNIIKAVDSFFMTGSGENYVATIVNPPTVDESDMNLQTNQESSNNYIRNRNQSFEPRFKERRNTNENNFKRRDYDYTESKMNKRFKEEENLHPSWAAKQKMKPIIANFQGKKTTFDADTNQTRSPATNFVQKLNTVEPDSGLHPSWAAKQKLKPIIGDFKGTKIKFDD